MCSSYVVFLIVTKLESSDQDGNETQMSFNTYRQINNKRTQMQLKTNIRKAPWLQVWAFGHKKEGKKPRFSWSWGTCSGNQCLQGLMFGEAHSWKLWTLSTEDVPQSVHLHTCRYVPQIVSFENSQKWSLQTKMGTTPKCHSRPKWSEKTHKRLKSRSFFWCTFSDLDLSFVSEPYSNLRPLWRVVKLQRNKLIPSRKSCSRRKVDSDVDDKRTNLPA